MKTGDVSRRRRFADPARMRWYAHYRAVRFSRRLTACELRKRRYVLPLDADMPQPLRR